MLKLTKKADYGLISLKHLAMKGGSASAKEIAEAYGIPSPLLAKVLQKLARSGFLASEHGTHGGYRLARPARAITALEVVKAIDGPVFLTSCFTGQNACGQAQKCSVREPLRRVHEGILSLLGGMTVADMCEEAEEDAGDGCHGGTAAEAELTVLSGV